MLCDSYFKYNTLLNSPMPSIDLPARMIFLTINTGEICKSLSQHDALHSKQRLYSQFDTTTNKFDCWRMLHFKSGSVDYVIIKIYRL